MLKNLPDFHRNWWKIGFFGNFSNKFTWNDFITLPSYIYRRCRHKMTQEAYIWLNIINFEVKMRVKNYVKITQIWHGSHISKKYCEKTPDYSRLLYICPYSEFSELSDGANHITSPCFTMYDFFQRKSVFFKKMPYF